jgi:hypothetical protein
MPVPKEELVKDLETPEYLTLVKEALAKKEFIVQDKTEHASYLDRYKSDVIEKELPSRVKAVHDSYDKDTKDLFGVDRDPNEKSYDYLKRAAKGKLTELEASAKKIQDLEAAIAKGDTSAAMAAKLEAEEKKFKTILREKDDKISALEKQSLVTSKSADIKLIYGEIKKSFVKQLPPLFARAEAAALDEVVNNSVVKEGKLYMSNPDGSIRKDASYNEITVEDYLKREFKDVIEVQKKQGGAGSPPGGGDGAVDPAKLTPDNFPMKENIKTKAELTDYMLSLGLKQGTKEFQAIWTKFGYPMNQ